MEKKISFGKIDFNHCGRKINELVVEVELRERGGEKTFRYINGQREFTGESTPAYIEFSACAAVWNSKHTDWIAGGQCFKDLLPYLGQLTKEKRLLFWRIYDLWDNWHLNGMNAGTPEQEAAVRLMRKEVDRWIPYEEICSRLKELDLYEVPFTGLTTGKRYNGELYRYGSGWVIREIPEDVLAQMKKLFEEEQK